MITNKNNTSTPERKHFSRDQNRSNGKITWLGDGIEWIFKSIFLPYSERSYRKAGSPWGVIISEKYLKFHPHDRRREIRNAIWKD